jgi:hypothetical protein
VDVADVQDKIDFGVGVDGVDERGRCLELVVSVGTVPYGESP